jgi:hypothetical protein
MSTPNLRHCTLEGLALYAPRRAGANTAAVEERWRAKLERIAAAIASVEAIETEHSTRNPAPDIRQRKSRAEDSQTSRRSSHQQSSPSETADWPAFESNEWAPDSGALAAEEYPSESDEFATDECTQDSGAFATDECTPDSGAFATDEFPLDSDAYASDQLQHHSPPDPEAQPQPPIRVAHPAGLPLLVRTSLIVCGAAMATFGLAAILTFPSDGHSPANAGNNVAIAEAAAAVSNGTGVTFRGPRQDRINSGVLSDSPGIEPPGEQAAVLMQRGQELLQAGDVANARRAFQVLADRGNAEAALALARTFDQSSAAIRNAVDAVADDAKARAWYQRAMELGSSEAKRALVRMATQ